MKTTPILWLLAAGLLVSAAANAKAQNSGNTATAAQRPGDSAPTAWQSSDNAVPITTPVDSANAANTPGQGKVVRLFGCVERGSGPNEYALMGDGANWWELKSNSIDLSAYLDQTVMIAASPSPNPGGSLNVVALAMVHGSCTNW